MSGLSGELHPAWIWLGGSFAMAVLAANVAWLLRGASPGPLDDTVSRLRGWPGSSALHQTVRLLFYIGVPFGALLLGQDAVTERTLGLQPLEIPSGGRASAADVITENWANWAQDTGWAVAAGVSTLLLMLAAWWAYRRALAAVDLREGSPIEGSSGWVHLREAAFHEVHWAFYRGASLVALHDHPQGAYWGVWIGLGITGLEASLNPAWRHALADPQEAPARLLRVALALLSAVVFWKTQNLWLAIGLHTAISWAMSAIAVAAARSAR